MSDKCKNLIDLLPSFLDGQGDFSDGLFFNNLKKVTPFNEVYICFLNYDSIQVKYKYSASKNIKIGDSFAIDENLKTKLFNQDSFILDLSSEFLNFFSNENDQISAMVSKLIIQNTVFGFILFIKNKLDFYSKEDIEISSVLSKIIAYKIKDLELSDVFNYQLKALAQSVIDTKNANEKILEADKIKTQFLANVSHELRTPLNSIIGFSDMLSTKLFGDLSEKQAEYVNEINSAGVHLLGMINEILDISKIEANAMTLNMSKFYVSLIIKEVLNIIKPLLEKKNLSVDTFADDFEILADAQKIRQILFNLLSNAIKFSDENSKIEVKSTLENNDFILEVRDFGVGIDKINQAKIFEKFIQLENTYTKKESSTGLGLTIVKEFVQMHGGEVFVESEKGKGATFKIILPQNL